MYDVQYALTHTSTHYIVQCGTWYQGTCCMLFGKNSTWNGANYSKTSRTFQSSPDTRVHRGTVNRTHVVYNTEVHMYVCVHDMYVW